MTEAERDAKPRAAGPGTGPAHPRESLLAAAAAWPGRRLRRALRCRKGFAATTEFAAYSVPAVLMIAVACEVGWQMAAAAALDYGATRAARFASTGSTTLPYSTESASGCRTALIPIVVADATNGFLRKERLTWSATSYPNYAAAEAGQGGTTGAGKGGQTVSYAFSYEQPYLFANVVAKLLPQLAEQKDARTYRVNLIAKNEPFTDVTC